MHRVRALPYPFLPMVLAGTVAVLVATVVPAEAATTVDLGTAGSFGVLAGSGITNSGQTAVTGDLGTSPTPAETGTGPCPAANCISLTGSNHPADAAAVQAKKDLTTAYDAAAGEAPDAVLGSELGGQTFTAGVYKAASSLGLTGTVTLDAKNVRGAVFVFQVGSSLVTASSSDVRLVNGASACNVFFQIGSAATLGTSSTFRGTILAHDDISLGDSVTVDGRLLGGEQASGAGAVTLIHDTITRPSCTGTTGSGTTTAGPSSTPTVRPSSATPAARGRTTALPATASGATSRTLSALPFSGAPTASTGLLGGVLVMGGALLLLLGRTPRRATAQPSSSTP